MGPLVDIPDDRLADLDAYGRRIGKSRAEVIREAIREFLEDKVAAHGDVFGIWADRGLDGLAYEASLRAEWQPPTADGSPLGGDPDRPVERRRRSSR